jgi:TolA-binding protein
MLRPKKHITRQKIKEDKFITRTLQTADWVKTRQKQLIYGAIAVAVLVFVVLGLTSARRATERQASLLVLQAGYAIDQSSYAAARGLLTEAVERYGSSRSGGRATFMLAQLLFHEGSTDSSRTLYQRYLDRYGHDDLLKAAARAGLAACMEAAGEFVAAAEAYEKSADSFRGSGNAAHYLLQAGRCHRLAGNDREALSIYDRITEEYPNNAEADRARIERAMLARQGGVPQ